MLPNIGQIFLGKTYPQNLVTKYLKTEAFLVLVRDLSDGGAREFSIQLSSLILLPQFHSWLGYWCNSTAVRSN